MKQILLLATGGTIATRKTSEGLVPQLTSRELLAAIPEISQMCRVDTLQLYQVGHTIKTRYGVLEAYDMTLEAVLAKTMWLLGQSKDPDVFRTRFHVPVMHDILLPETSGGNF